MPLTKRVSAEFIGTFWLVFGGCGSAVLSAAFPEVGIGFLGVGAGLRADRADHGLRHRAHLRLPPQPGRLARAVGRRALPVRDLLPYIVAQVVGAIVGAGVLLRDRQRQAGFDLRPAASPPTATPSTPRGATRCWPASSTEVVLTFMFLLIILGATDGRAPGASRRSPSAWG